MSTGDYFNFIWNFGTILQTSKLHSDMGEIGSNCVRVSECVLHICFCR